MTPSHAPIIEAAARVGLVTYQLTECNDGDGPEAVAYFFGGEVLPGGAHRRRARVSIDGDGDVFGYLVRINDGPGGEVHSCNGKTLDAIMIEVAKWVGER